MNTFYVDTTTTTNTAVSPITKNNVYIVYPSVFDNLQYLSNSSTNLRRPIFDPDVPDYANQNIDETDLNA